MADSRAVEPHVAHHFHSSQQQFDAGKLGIWLFLLTEVLFFSGLFCAYAVFRAAHPEIFNYAHYFLDTRLGALNTCILLVSSLTAALSVRCRDGSNPVCLRNHSPRFWRSDSGAFSHSSGAPVT